MVIRLKTAFIIILSFLILGFIFAERTVLTPFVAAAIFAYIFNPLVNFFSHKIKLPRSISVLIIFALLISAFIVFIIFLTRGLLYESTLLTETVDKYVKTAKIEINSLPDYVRPTVLEGLNSIETSKLWTTSLFQFFPRAVSGTISLFIFLFSSFYFLKEGRSFIEKGLVYVPKNYKVEVEIVLRRINGVLGGYLRGQIFMIFLVSTVLFVALSILGIRFALIIAIFSGIAEIVPIIGPIVATIVAVVTVLISGGSTNFPIPMIQTALLVVLIYFVVRQSQDIFIIPHVMGRITKLHPLVILFAVLSGGHIAGILGLLLAVPIAGVIKILLEFFSDTITDKELGVEKSSGS